MFHKLPYCIITPHSFSERNLEQRLSLVHLLSSYSPFINMIPSEILSQSLSCLCFTHASKQLSRNKVRSRIDMRNYSFVHVFITGMFSLLRGALENGYWPGYLKSVLLPANHSRVHSFQALFYFGLFYCECGFSFQLCEIVMMRM